jgi:N-acetyl sugar amidotransferase
MDTTDPEITFNAEGICNHCQSFEVNSRKWWFPNDEGQKRLGDVLEKIKREGRGKEYDCIIGLSGGVDSSYAAYIVKKLGLRPLAVHFDSGWNSELAVKNIEGIIKKLEIDLYTVVCDWEEMRDIQLSFFKASVANCDIPQDHTFIAALYQVAIKKKIRYLISGNNMATEAVLPQAWGYTSEDRVHLESIQKRFGTIKLRKLPRYNLFQYFFYYPYVKRIKQINILNYMPYDKGKAKSFLIGELGWRDYGGKHCESKFTRFFQTYYLPVKFGYDKRRAHLSSLIVSGQITRKEALREMEKPLFVEDEIREDKEFVAKKLGLTLKGFEDIIALPKRTYRDYPSSERVIRLRINAGIWVRKVLTRIGWKI